MVAGADSGRPRLAGILTDALEAVQGRSGRHFSACRRAAVILVDGLGWGIIHRYSGYLRSLRGKSAAPIFGSFPSTTAVALTSLATGTLPGAHGILEYAVYDETTGTSRNLLSGWPSAAATAGWASTPTLYERAQSLGIAAIAIGATRYRTSGFSEITLRGAEYRPADTLEAGFAELERALAEPGPGIVYLYVDSIDHAGHRAGVGSPEYLAALDALDAALGQFRPPRGTEAVLTADHGMLNVTRRRTLQEIPGADDLVQLTSGEPRMAVLVCRDGKAAAVQTAHLIADGLGEGFDVLPTRDLWASGLLGGPPAPGWSRRLGDVCVVATDGESAFYDERTASPASFRMIGQHGGASRTELTVPLIHLESRAAERLHGTGHN